MATRILCTSPALALALALSLALVFSEGAVGAETQSKPVTLWSEGVRLAGDVFKPAGIAADTKLPGVLLVHGWGGTKDHLKRAYAPQLAKLGFVVMVFDFKSWGESNGPLLLTEKLPATEAAVDVEVNVKHMRTVVNPASMLEDTRAALYYLLGEANVQADNIGIWGTSLGGGLVVVTAAQNPQIKALVTQIGAVNNKANFSMLPDSEVRKWETLRARGDIASFPGAESASPGLKGYPDLIAMKRYDPAAYWNDLDMPTLVIDAESEELFDRNQNGKALYDSLKGRVDTQYLVFPGKHYAIYQDEGYRQALKAAQDWFVRYLKN